MNCKVLFLQPCSSPPLSRINMKKVNVFNKAINDLFMIDDFIDEVIIDGEVYSSWITPVSEENSYTAGGLEELAPFEITLKLPLPRIPKIGGKVNYKGDNFKISMVEKDIIAGFVTLHLVTMSKGV